MIVHARFHTRQPGIESWHALSAGPHYDPDRVSFGPIVGCDEHVVAPGAGFDWHAHRGVQIVSVVLSGTLWHRDADGERFVGAGGVLVQSTGTGIRHAEHNPSDVEPLHFVQITLLADAAPRVWEADLPADVAGTRIELRGAGAVSPSAFAMDLDDGRVLVVTVGS